MRATIIIPTYWGRPKGEPIRKNDAVYDHPTPLDEEGTLARAIDSISVLKNSEFSVVVLACSTASDIASFVEEKVKGIVNEFRGGDFPILCLSHSFGEKLKRYLSSNGKGEFLELVSLTGYSNIRNFCLIVSELARSEIAVLFDDDEVYEDPYYLDKVFEDMNSSYDGKPIRALAGYYKQADGGYLLSPGEWWMAEWPMVRTMNEAFKIIGEGDRLKRTPFVFGGNMCIHRDVYRKIAFDPNVRRGEDIDYLVNCKFYGIDFILDRELSVRHLPPKSHTPAWQHFRENIYRFVYAREKLAHEEPGPGMRQVSISELEPYPASCMGDDLEDLIFKTSVLMGLYYLEKGDQKGFNESMTNIFLARHDAPPSFNPFKRYIEYKKRWEEFMNFLAGDENLSEEFVKEMEG